MLFDKSVIERAIELARGGVCPNIIQIERRLRKEGYEAPDQHLHGAGVHRQLNELLHGKIGNSSA